LQIKLFDALIALILLYGSAIWGFEKNGIVEKLHLQFCRNVLKVRTSTPCYMIYGELGRVPLDCRLKLNMVMFWNRLAQCENKLSNTLYKLMRRLSEHENVQFKWLNLVKFILDETGFSEYWTDQNSLNPKFFKLSLKQRMHDQFIQRWLSDREFAKREFILVY
jgi:hypothetical protein